MTNGYLYHLLRTLHLSERSARTGQLVLGKPLRILLIVLGAALVARLVARAVRRLVASMRRRAPLPRTVRGEQRAATVGDAGANLARALVAAVALMLVLDELGLNLAPLLAGAGIAGVALGFGAQSLVKDFLSGLFILLEDQYGIGDVVCVAEVVGTVEEVSLRVTRLRGMDGTVYFVPNGEVRKVGNSSMEWSLALLDVSVGRDADVATVSRLVEAEAGAFAADHPDEVLEVPELWGVQAMTPEALVLRLSVKTAPRMQWTVARDLRIRLSDRLRREDVPGPAGKAVSVSAGGLDQGVPVTVAAATGKVA
jgi:small conductance mechanosensitive channel